MTAVETAGAAHLVHRWADCQVAQEAIATESGCATTCEAAFVVLLLTNSGLGGRALLETIRSCAPVVPVLVISPCAEPTEIAACYGAGANSYLVSPPDVGRQHHMLARVAAFWLKTATLPPPLRRHPDVAR